MLILAVPGAHEHDWNADRQTIFHLYIIVLIQPAAFGVPI